MPVRLTGILRRLSGFFRRHSSMTYSSYLVKCCDEVERAREYDSDSFLVALVKIQQLLGRAADLIPYGDDDASRSVNYAPIHMAITAVKRELDALVRQQPPEVECNCTSSPPSGYSASHLDIPPSPVSPGPFWLMEQ